ncbi:MAG: hypothetical protein ICV51_19965 [Flavisolibacter sp.]|nr:hypothetical protein [Flavisolibacter sp.]
MGERKPDAKRANIAFVFLIIVGLVIGFLIRRVHIGLLIGLAMGLMAAGVWRKR